MDPTPLETVLIGGVFVLLGGAMIWGAIQMGSGPSLTLIGLGAIIGGVVFSVLGLVRMVRRR